MFNDKNFYFKATHYFNKKIIIFSFLIKNAKCTGQLEFTCNGNSVSVFAGKFPDFFFLQKRLPATQVPAEISGRKDFAARKSYLSDLWRDHDETFTATYQTL